MGDGNIVLEIEEQGGDCRRKVVDFLTKLTSKSKVCH